MSNKYEEMKKELSSQVRGLLPLIEDERAAFIEAEKGRLSAVMGTGYWNGAANDFEIFHGKKGDELALIQDRPRDPYDITIEEIYRITTLYKKIERCGTETYTDFFHMMPDDRERIELLAGMWKKLTHGQLCTQREAERLIDGHDAFIDRKLTSTVRVIGNIEFEQAPERGLNGGFHVACEY